MALSGSEHNHQGWIRDDDGREVVVLASGTVSVTGITQYTEGDTDASITGQAMLWEDTSDTLRAVSAAKPLPVAEVYAALTLSDVGEIAGNTSATIMPTVTSKWVKLKAQFDNVGKVYVGLSDVTKSAGTEDATSGWQLSAGEEMPWLPLSNLNQLYRITDNAGDDLCYMILT